MPYLLILIILAVVGNFISLLFSQHKKLEDRIKTMSEKGMQVTKRIDVKHTQIFQGYIKKIVGRGMVTAPDGSCCNEFFKMRNMQHNNIKFWVKITTNFICFVNLQLEITNHG